MASKTQIHKARQGYVEKPVPCVCGNCENSARGKVPDGTWLESISRASWRCGLGGFAVKKTAVCNLYVPKGAV